MYHSFLVHSSADGHLGCFHVLAMTNSAAMNCFSFNRSKKLQPPILLSQVKVMLLCWECLRTGEKHGVDMYRGKSSCELKGLEKSNQLCEGLFTHVQNGGSENKVRVKQRHNGRKSPGTQHAPIVTIRQPPLILNSSLAFH